MEETMKYPIVFQTLSMSSFFRLKRCSEDFNVFCHFIYHYLHTDITKSGTGNWILVQI